jgi:uncharacterized protein YabN with tetrapyrrole methylase and pyrophosphatase domain
MKRLDERARAPRLPAHMDRSPPHAPTRPDAVAFARALAWAYRLQERAAGVGFDWPDARGPLAKVHEELGELAAALPPEGGDASAARVAVEDEIGDLVFAVVNLARKLAVDPHAALERATAKFHRRFEALERLAAQRGLDVARASLDVLDQLWEEVKAGEGPGT